MPILPSKKWSCVPSPLVGKSATCNLHLAVNIKRNNLFTLNSFPNKKNNSSQHFWFARERPDYWQCDRLSRYHKIKMQVMKLEFAIFGVTNEAKQFH